MATTLGVTQAHRAQISDLICARPGKAGVHPYLICVVWSSVFHEQHQPQHKREAPVPGTTTPGGGGGVWKASAFYPFISLMMEEEKDGEWLQM